MLQFEWSKTVRAIRLSAALLVTFFITWSCEVPEGIWALITCSVIVFEYTTFGGLLTKTFLRFLGTVLNGMAALIIVYLFANNAVVNLIALVMGIFINAYIFLDTSKSYSGVLGGITLAITLINYHDISTAILRIFNVLIGEGICLITFYCIFPEYARDNVIKIQVNVISEIVNILEEFLNKIHSLESLKIDYQSYEKEFIESITDFKHNMTEIGMEVKNAPEVIDEHLNAMRSLKHIYYLLNTFFYYMTVEKNRFKPQIIYTFQKMIEYLTVIQSLLQKPTEKKVYFTPIHEASIMIGHPILTALVEDIDKELDNLRTSCEKISVIRLHDYRKSMKSSV